MAPRMIADPPPSRPPGRPPGWLAPVIALFLFAVWSNSFVANEFLLEGGRPRFDWRSLAVARFLPAAALCWGYLLARRRREMIDVVRRFPVRLFAASVFVVPAYNFALGWGQQAGVPASIASLTTTLAPLFILLLASVILGERANRRWFGGLLVASVGMATIASARDVTGGVDYGWALLVTAGAPFSWACYSVLSKPVAGAVSPIVWSYLATAVGGVWLLPLLPGDTWVRWRQLDDAGWWALLYLSVPCTVVGFALWTWLLRHLPAIVVGLLVFLNPPLTTLSKRVLSSLAPETFAFDITTGEWVGGAVVLAGLALAIIPRRGARSP